MNLLFTALFLHLTITILDIVEVNAVSLVEGQKYLTLYSLDSVDVEKVSDKEINLAYTFTGKD